MPRKQSFNATFNVQQLARLHTLAAARDETVSELLRRAVDRYLDAEEARDRGATVDREHAV